MESYEVSLITPGKNAQVRLSLSKSLTTVGSGPGADIRLAGVPERWAVLQQEAGRVRIRLLGKDQAYLLEDGRDLTIDGHVISLTQQRRQEDSGLPVQPLADRLSDVESPRDALGLMLDGILDATGADHGAVIIKEEGDYQVAVTRAKSKDTFEDARELLSDRIVREVLASGSQVWVPDTGSSQDYAGVPSLVALKLRSVLCVPMRLHGVVLGAIFIGQRDMRSPLNQRQAQDLSLLASMAVPLLVQLRRLQSGTGSAGAIVVGEAEGIKRVRELIEKVAPSDLGVLIQGETGTGKELVARAVHAASPRAERPMVSINCSALPESLLEAELFGSRKGAFTGALNDRKGRIEQAHNSTLFLDEVGDMPLPMQAALLRVLESREVTRLGENQTRPVDFRLIAATHKDLDAEVEAGNFRKDLLYRLREFVIQVPRLADRSADILLLAHLFLRQAEQQLGLPAMRVGSRATKVLLEHRWPGNVRELRAAMRRAAILCDNREIEPAHLGLDSPKSETPQAAAPSETGITDIHRPLSEVRDEFVSRYVAAVLKSHDGDREAAAASLGISVRSLYRHLSSG